MLCVLIIIRVILMSIPKIPLFYIRKKIIPKLSPFVSRLGTRIHSLWLKVPMSRTNFHGPKYVSMVPNVFKLLKFDCTVEFNR